MKNKKTVYVDDDYESIKTIFLLRAPSLMVGLFLGIAISFIISNFEKVLAANVHVAFFIPFIVYISAAIGSQTGSIYARDLKSGHAKFYTYLHKEFLLGIIFGVLFGIFSGLIVLWWLQDIPLALSITLSTFIAISTAPVIALLVTQSFQSNHKDPAASSGPIATVIQDMISVIIYGIVTSLIML
ncbi:magnesium transporter [Patescibacteria group bacterium]|jgi:magnesium transporter|nr:magnesium transporter [Patescibacteria group bacterium]